MSTVVPFESLNFDPAVGYAEAAQILGGFAIAGLGTDDPDEMYREPVAYVPPKPTLAQQQLLFGVLRAGQESGPHVRDKDVGELLQCQAFVDSLTALPSDEYEQWQHLLQRGTVKAVIAGCFERLVAQQAKRYWREVSFSQKLDGGMAGLLNAIDRYDPDRGFTFITFGIMAIHKGVQDAVREATGMNHRSQCKVIVAAQIATMFSAVFDRLPSTDELRAQLMVNADGKEGRPFAGGMGHIDRMLAVCAGNSLTPLYSLVRWSETTAEQTAALLVNSEPQAATVSDVHAALAQLPDMQQQVVKAYFGMDNSDGHDSLDELSEAEANRLLAEALRALQPILAAQASGGGNSGEPCAQPEPSFLEWWQQLPDDEFLHFFHAIKDKNDQVRAGFMRGLSSVELAGLMGLSRSMVNYRRADIRATDPLFAQLYEDLTQSRRSATKLQQFMQEGRFGRDEMAAALGVRPEQVNRLTRQLRATGALPQLRSRQDFASPLTERLRQYMATGA